MKAGVKMNDKNIDKKAKILQDSMLYSARRNLENYNALLDTLQKCSLKDKDKRIQQCLYAIEKQKAIIANIEDWGYLEDENYKTSS